MSTTEPVSTEISTMPESAAGQVGCAPTTLVCDAVTGALYVCARGRDWGKSTVLSHDTVRAFTVRAKIAALLAGRNWHNTTGGYR